MNKVPLGVLSDMRKIKKPVIIGIMVVGVLVGAILLYTLTPHKKVVESETEVPKPVQPTTEPSVQEELADSELNNLYRELFIARSNASDGVGIIEQKTIKGITYRLSNDNNYLIKELGNKEYIYKNGVWEEYTTSKVEDTGTITKEEVLNKLGNLSNVATTYSKLEGVTGEPYNDFLHYFYSTYPDVDFNEIRVYSINDVNLCAVVSRDNSIKVFIGNKTYELTSLSFEEYKEVVNMLNVAY